MPNPLGRALRNRRAGHDTLAWGDAALAAPENITLTSASFTHGEPIPALHRGRIFATNISPELAWTSPPAGTVELALVIQDPDVPFRRSATHGLTVGIDPALGGLPENALASPSPVAGLSHGKGPFGKLGYAGPAPIPSHGAHSYVFQLYALDTALTLEQGFGLDELIGAMTGHVLGRGRLDGTYEVL